MWTLVAVGLGAVALLALTFGLDARARRRCAERDRSTLHAALVLNRQTEGLQLLAANVQRPAPWWSSTPPEQLEQIDDALTDWATVAGYVAQGRVDLDVILHAFGRRIVTMWEDAYTYVEDRHPDLWQPLLDLYVDACDAGHGDRSRFEEEPEDGLAVTPDDVPEAEDLPAELLTPLLASAPPEPSLMTEEPDRPAVIQAALAPVPAVDPAPAPAKRAVAAAEVDGPADLLIDLIGAHHADGPLPRAVHR